MIKTRLIWMGFMLVLIGVATVGVRHSDRFLAAKKEKERIEEQEKNLFNFTGDEVIRISLTREGETIVAERREENWRIVRPIQAVGDESGWNSLTRTLAGVRIQTEIEAASGLADFGLEDPCIRVAMIVKGSSREHTLLIGDKTQTGDEYYVKTEDSPRVATAYSHIHNTADKSLFDLRDRHLMEFDQKDPERFEIMGMNGFLLAFDTFDPKDYVMVRPRRVKADEGKVNGLLSQVKGRDIAFFGPESPTGEQLEAYGLADPATHVIVGFGKGAAARETALLIGSASEYDGFAHYWAKRERAENVFLIPERIAKNLTKDPAELRCERLAKMKSWEIEDLVVERKGKDTIHVRKDQDGNWKMKSPQEAEGDSDGVRDFVGFFSNVSGGYKIKDYIFDVKDLSEYGLSDPPYVVTFKAGEWQESFTASDLTETQPEGSSKTVNRVYAQWVGFPELVLEMEVTHPILTQLNKPAWRFGDIPKPTPTVEPSPPPSSTPSKAAAPPADSR